MPAVHIKNNPQVIGSEDLTLEEARQRLDETGGIVAASVAQASELTGFDVREPSFLPEGYVYVRILLLKFGANPSESPDNALYMVTLDYLTKDNLSSVGKASVSVIQSTGGLGMPGGEEIELCGIAAARRIPDESGLMLSWSEDPVYYAVVAQLNNGMDEETLRKIACSIIEQ